MTDYPLSNIEHAIMIEYSLPAKRVVQIDFNGVSRAKNSEKLGL